MKKLLKEFEQERHKYSVYTTIHEHDCAIEFILEVDNIQKISCLIKNDKDLNGAIIDKYETSLTIDDKMIETLFFLFVKNYLVSKVKLDKLYCNEDDIFEKTSSYIQYKENFFNGKYVCNL